MDSTAEVHQNIQTEIVSNQNETNQDQLTSLNDDSIVNKLSEKLVDESDLVSPESNEEQNGLVDTANDQTVANSINQTDSTKSIDSTSKQTKFEFNPKYETYRMKEYLKRAKQATSQYNKLINQERKDERRICLDLQTYTLHYPLGLGAENRMLKRNLESGRCGERTKYPIAVLPGHYQNNYRKFTSDELKYFPINTVVYGPVITDVDKLPPLLTRIEENSFSDSDSDSSSSTEHSCCCDEKACKKLKLNNGSAEQSEKCNCLNELSSSVSSDDDDEPEEEIDEQPPKLVNVFHFTQRENANCDVCKKNELIKPDGSFEKLIHCTDCILSFHPTCLEMTPEMIQQIQLYPWECSQCKRCVICSIDYYESNMLICDLCDKASHAMCVGLKGVPVGKWFCKLCCVKQKYIKR